MLEKRTIIGIKRAFFFLAAFLMTNAALNRPVWAHPHVWVTMTSEIAYDPNGQVEGVRHAWSFDEAYSAFAVQGLDTNQDGTTSREELQELAKINTESLIEFNYFTVVKADGKKQVSADQSCHDKSLQKKIQRWPLWPVGLRARTSTPGPGGVRAGMALAPAADVGAWVAAGNSPLNSQATVPGGCLNHSGLR